MSIIRLFDPEILEIMDKFEINKFANENRNEGRGKLQPKQSFNLKK